MTLDNADGTVGYGVMRIFSSIVTHCQKACINYHLIPQGVVTQHTSCYPARDVTLSAGPYQSLLDI